jgi:diguanylate cyclase (GGDEF)-like protein/PAS domain S-box-containing protein
MGAGILPEQQHESNTLRLRRAETDQLAHLHLVDSLDRVNSVVLGTNDLESMMSEVLEAVLSIFECDRAWLLYPCDPAAPTWCSPMEKTRAEYPGAGACGTPLPVDAEHAAAFRELLAASGPVAFGPGAEHPLPRDSAERFGYRSSIAMALYPKVGSAWAFGLHQCSHERAWKPQELTLLEQIGRRITDGLTSLLTYRDLQRTEREFRSLAENSPDMISRVDRDGRYLYVNATLARLAGLPAADFIGKFIGATRIEAGHTLDQNTVSHLRSTVQAALATGTAQRCEVLDPKPGGENVYEYRISPERDESGRVVSALCVGRDVTDRQRAELGQKRLIRSLRLISMNNQLLIHAQEESELFAEVCRLIVEVGNYRLAWLTLSQGQSGALQRPTAKFGAEEGRFDSLDTAIPDWLWARGLGGRALEAGQVQVVQDVGADPALASWRDLLLTRGLQSGAALPLRDARGVLGTLTVFARNARAFPAEELELLQELAGDITYGLRAMRTRSEHWAAEQKLAFMALHDPLTKLPNRVQLRERFELALAVARRKQTRMALLFLDLDNFKEINDSLGHEVGDKLLLQVAERLQSRLPHNGMVAREGGDEFLMLLPDIAEHEAIERFVKEILQRIDQPLQIGDNLLQTTASCGISVYPEDGADFESLRRNSDAALFHAKDEGRNIHRFFNERMNRDALARVEMQGRLRQALRNQQFQLHYQPQLRVHDRRIIGMEALIRWRGEDGQQIPPATFIPVAEKSGLIIPIGQWVLEEACRQAMVWHQSGLPPLLVAVNLSAVQFARGEVIEAVKLALGKSGLPAEQLELEITESVLLHETDNTLETLHTLRKLGVKLSIDDFGTGYSSLAYLKRLPVDKLKIAHPFVKQLASSREDAAIVRAIIQLGQTLGLDVIAEGVEVEAQLRFLKANGCNLVQGFLISRPLAAEDFPGLFQRHSR